MTSHQFMTSSVSGSGSASIKASENVYYAKLINFDRAKRSKSGQEAMTSFAKTKPVMVSEFTPSSRFEEEDENEYSDICEYDEPKYFEIGRFQSGLTKGDHKSSSSVTTTATTTAMAGKDSGSLVSPVKSASSRLSSVKSVEAHNNRTSSATSTTFSDSSSLSSSSFSKLSSPCLTEQIYETLSKKLSDFKINMPPYSNEENRSSRPSTASATVTGGHTVSSTSTSTLRKSSNPNHIPYQSATLLVKKSPGDAKYSNACQSSSSESGKQPVQYSLITTQITTNKQSDKRPAGLAHFRSALNIGGQHSGANSSSSTGYLVKQQQIDFDVDDQHHHHPASKEAGKRDFMLMFKAASSSSYLLMACL